MLIIVAWNCHVPLGPHTGISKFLVWPKKSNPNSRWDVPFGIWYLRNWKPFQATVPNHPMNRCLISRVLWVFTMQMPRLHPTLMPPRKLSLSRAKTASPRSTAMVPLLFVLIWTLNDRFVAYETKIRYHGSLIHHGKTPWNCSVPQSV